MRYALMTHPTTLAIVRRYLPDNYAAIASPAGIVLMGVDWHGWTLDDYVLPRLASGGMYAREVTR